MGVDIPVIWFAIIVFATLMYIIMDGFDLGIGMLFSFVGDAKERDVMVNSVAPVWDGNETWLVLGGARVVRRVSAGLRGNNRCPDHPADGHADRAYFPRRGV